MVGNLRGAEQGAAQVIHATQGRGQPAGAQPGRAQGTTRARLTGARAGGARREDDDLDLEENANAPEPACSACTCTGDVRATGFTATGPRSPGVPEHWFVHAGCGQPTSAYRAAMLVSDAAANAVAQQV